MSTSDSGALVRHLKGFIDAHPRQCHSHELVIRQGGVVVNGFAHRFPKLGQVHVGEDLVNAGSAPGEINDTAGFKVQGRKQLFYP